MPEQEAAVPKIETEKNKVHQSPIDITRAIVRRDKSLKGKVLRVDYHKGDVDTITIEDEGFLATTKDGADSCIIASHLKSGDYRLWQFHMHWGHNAHDGSEHCIGSKRFAGEIHCVFWNKNLGSREEALKHCDGFTVLAIFVDEAEEDNPNLAPVITAIDQALEADDRKAPISADFDLSHLLPEKHSYYTYDGSLTTAPFAECVTWTILHRHIPIGRAQLAVLRKITDRNVRQPQKLHDREVHASFRYAHVAQHGHLP
uniref:Alpha-carbonic anhydrase domain-containing protein n=1 Tax=Panagrellus redivivus TaxID=6233 RepID=A0A7E4VFI5_PANRE